MNVTVIIPSLDPDEKLSGVVHGLTAIGFEDILLVDDGSDAAHQAPFAELEQLPQVTVLHHPVNYGKGRALKTAFAYVLEQRPACRGVITVDGDGQHGAQDILRITRALLEEQETVFLGARDFDDPKVPGRSRFGNKASRFTMRLLCGMKLQDTQTGLRGIPVSLLPAFLEVEGDRFEYETNMLLEIRRQRIAYKELIIDTIYINENETSHFRPLRDGWRVYSLLLGYFLRFVCSSLLCAVADVLLFTLFLHTLFARSSPDAAVLWATVLARVLSSILNFAINRRVVFRSERSVASTLWRYYALCVCQMLASALLVMALNVLPIAEPLIKCVVDGVLFLVSYRIQRRFVFGKR